MHVAGSKRDISGSSRPTARAGGHCATALAGFPSSSLRWCWRWCCWAAIYLIEGPENGFTSIPVSLVFDRYLRVRA